MLRPHIAAGAAPGNIQSAFLRIFCFIFFWVALTASQHAAAQAVFSNLVVSPTSGTADASGHLSVTFSGNVSATSGSGDSVESVDVLEGSTLLASQTYMVYFDKFDQPMNTARTFSMTVALGAGTHQIQLRADTFNELSMLSQTFTITVSPAVPPSAAFTSPSDGATYPANGTTTTVTFAGTASPGSGATLSSVQLLEGGTAFASGASSSISGSKALSVGSHTIELRVTDSSSRVVSAYLTVKVVPPPTASFTSPAEGTVYTASGTAATVSFAGTASAGTAGTLSSVQLLEGGVAFASGTSGSITGSKSLAAGNHTIELRVKDSINQTTSVYRTVSVIPPAPTASFSSPANGASYTASGSTASVSVSATAVSGPSASISQMTLYVDGALSATSSTSALAKTLSLAVGSHTLGIEAVDNYGTTGTRSSVTVTVLAATPPTASFNSPANGASYTATGNTASVSVSASGSPGSSGSISQMKLYMDGSLSATSSSATLSATLSLFAGSHTLGVEAVDNFGVTGLRSNISVTVVAQPATTITLTSPANGAGIGLGTQTLVASVTGPATSVKFFANGTQISGTANANGSSWSQTWTPGVPGSYAVQARVYDGTGAQVAQTTANVTASGVASSDVPVAINISVPELGNGVAGTLPGHLQVTNNGAAAYSIPIAVPPGTAGMRPTLSLDYNSDNSTGSAGLGWSLGGLSNIDRCGKTVAIDGVTHAVKFTTADRLCLDGQRLILENGANDDASYWADGALYRTEVESFTRVTALGIGVTNRSFKVEMKDRALRWFGWNASANSVLKDLRTHGTGLIHRWRIDTTQDRAGNYINYVYKNFDNGENKPDTISWGGNGTASFAKVVFGYAPRSDTRHPYVNGSPTFETQILKTIITSSTSDAGAALSALTYTLTHTTSPTSGRNLLRQVQVCAADATCLPATTFQWGERDPGATKAFIALGTSRAGPNLEALGGTVATQNLHGPTYDGPMDMVITGDFNGDGRTDILERTRVAANSYQQRLFTSSADGTSWTITNPVPGGIGTGTVLNAGDFNGDGKLDLLTADIDGTGAPISLQVCLDQNGSYVCQPVNLPADALKSAIMNTRAVRDFDADGRDDLFLSAGAQAQLSTTIPPRYFCTGYTLAAGFNCQFTTFDLLTQDPRDLPHNAVGHDSADVDGDGHVDEITLNRCMYRIDPYSMTGTYSWYCGDESSEDGISVFGRYSGDGTDINTGWYPLSSATPRGLIPQVAGGTLSADLSGDGYTDVVIGTTSLLSDGITFGSDRDTTLCTSHGDGSADCVALPPLGTGLDHLIMTVHDFDGDGVSDILRPGVDTASVSSFNTYVLCRVLDGGGAQTCENWTGPTFYSLDRHDAFAGRCCENSWGSTNSGFYGDFDGDGIIDISTYAANGQWQVYKASSQAKPGQVLDKIVSVTNGVGLAENVQFALSGDTSVYNGDGAAIDSGALPSGLPIKRVPNKRPLVSRLETSNGATGSKVIRYSYAGYAVDGQGRGNLGFASLTTVDETSNVTTTTWFSQQFPSVGVMTDRLAVHGEVELERTHVTVNSFDRSSKPGAVGKVIPYVVSSSTTTKDLTGSSFGTKVTTYSYDDWVNPSTVKEETTLGSSDLISTTTTVFSNDQAGWLLGLPTSVVVTRTTDQGAQTLTRTTNYAYDAGLLTSETREPGNQNLRLITTYDRSASGAPGNPFGLVNKTQIQWHDPVAGNDQTRVVSQTTYDQYGRYSTQVLNALNQPEKRLFDPTTGAETSVTAINGLTTTFTVDGFGRTLSQIRPDGTAISTLERQCDSACPAGATTAFIKRTLLNGALTSIPVVSYSDSAGHVLRTQTWGFDGTSIVADAAYDSAGREWEVDQPRNVNAGAVLAKRTTYDDLGRPTKVEKPDELGATHAWGTVYDGWTTTFTQPGPSGASSGTLSRTETRDVWSRLATTVDTMGSTTTFNHDPFGNLTRTTDIKGNVVNVAYDTLGRRTDLHDPDLGWIHYDVDPLGQVYRQISPNERAKSQATTFQYDALGRMANRSEPDLMSNWVFDNGASCSPSTSQSCGKLVEANTVTGTTKDYVRTLSYDNLGRPRTTNTTLDTVYTSTTEYDSWGRVLRQHYQRTGGAEKVFDYRYNGNGYLARIERAGLVLWRPSAEDVFGNVTAALLGNGATVSRGYNQYTGELSSAGLANNASSPLLSESYDYDLLGNVVQRSAYWDTAAFSESFAYDDLNRLHTSTIGNTVSTFNYDAIGNIVSKTGVGTGNYVYPAPGASSVGPHAVSSISSIGGFLYDANGNMSSGAGRTVTWTTFDMPVKISKGAESSTFVYGPEHQRIRQDKADGSHIYYAGPMEVEVSASGAATVKTYWPSGLGLENEGPSGILLYWTHLDRQGSVIAITDQNGVVKERMAYDSWGKRRDLGDANTPDSIDGVTDNKGYTGHEMLDRLDLVHMNGRVYDPLVARFISADPFIQDPEHSQSYNRYTYVWNNPTNLTDPTGFIGSALTGGFEAEGDAPVAEFALERQNEQSESRPSNSADHSSRPSLDAAQVDVRGKRPNVLFEQWLLDQSLQAARYGRRVYAARKVIIPVARAAAIRIGPRVLAAQAFDETGVGAVIGLAGAAYGAWQIGSSVVHAVNEADMDPEDALSGQDTNSGDKPNLLDDKGETHVLDGDATGGGHRPGTGKPGKSEFPSNWSDDKIKGEISDVATDPNSTRTPGRGGRTVVQGTRDGIDITVVVEPGSKGGRIVTGFPTNVPRNPK